MTCAFCWTSWFGPLLFWNVQVKRIYSGLVSGLWMFTGLDFREQWFTIYVLVFLLCDRVIHLPKIQFELRIFFMFPIFFYKEFYKKKNQCTQWILIFCSKINVNHIIATQGGDEEKFQNTHLSTVNDNFCVTKENMHSIFCN